MTPMDFPDLPPFDDIKKFLQLEKDTIVKVNSFSDDSFVRNLESAQLILDFLMDIQKELHQFFKENLTLLELFNNEFWDFYLFLSREYIIETCFLDKFLFPESESFPLEKNDVIYTPYFESYKEYFKNWMEKTLKDHQETIKELKENFNINQKEDEIQCHCQMCVAEFRNRLREGVFKNCLEIIISGKEEISSKLDKGIPHVSEMFYQLQKDLEKTILKVRYRFKKSTFNRLDAQLKNEFRQLFTFPGEMAKQYSTYLMDFFENCLRSQGLRKDLLNEFEYERFYSQLGFGLWKKESFLEKEFKRLLKSILALKRKDISGNILKNYLGEFWIYSRAREIKRKIVYHTGPTNSGKTYHAIENLCQQEKGCYLAPLRLLAAELYDTMNSKGVPTSLMTGEEVIEVPNAQHFSSTIEMAKFGEFFDCCVIDEIQMISDSQRGWAWTRALVNVFAKEVHICGDNSVLDLIKKIVELCGDELEIIEYERMTKLEIEPKKLRIGDLKKNDALIVFSRKNALRYKMDLEQLGLKVSIVYGRLGPEVRREQARKFDQGETDVMVSTDAIAMGMNLPIKRIVFSTLSKYINNKEFPITESEIKQIGGRAGRYKRFPIGHINCLSRVDDGLERIRYAMSCDLPQKTKCMVGPDLDIFGQVNKALETQGLPILKLSEFLRLFNTMIFKAPFYCVDLKEMIEIAEMVENADIDEILKSSEIFGFACAPVNLGLMEHVQYFIWILNNYVRDNNTRNEPIEYNSDDIDYLETAIKCVELYQWLARHFDNYRFEFVEKELLENKGKAIEKLNDLLSEKIVPTCSSCGKKMGENHQFRICEECFHLKKFRRPTGNSFRPKERRTTTSSNKTFDKPKTIRKKKNNFRSKVKKR